MNPQSCVIASMTAGGPPHCAGLCTDDGLREADRNYRRRLVARARTIVSDPDLAEEAVQEAFLRGWRACSTFDPTGGPVLHWLLTITRNVAVDLARARARRPPVAPGSVGRDAAANTPDLAELVAVRAELGQALLSISGEQRQAIIETILIDRAPVEVAAEIGIPTGTLRSRLHYGLRQLRELLDEPAAA